MFNMFAKFLLVSTSLSPLLGAVAVNQISNCKPFAQWGPWLAAAILLIFLCWKLLQYAVKNVEVHSFRIREFEQNEKEVLAFLVTYLLPFLSKEKMSFMGDWITGAYILLIIFLVISHSDAFHFNPVMSLLGYHFYSVKTPDGVSCLFISKNRLRRPNQVINSVSLTHNIYLDTGGNENA